MDCEVTRDALYEANEAASTLYEKTLQTPLGKRTLEYLHQRAFTDETLQRFRIGYAPADWHFAFRELHQEQGIPTQTLLTAGIIKENKENQTMHDFLHDRITFPLQDYRGIVGFTARFPGVIKESEDSNAPRIIKYINTPTTPLYQKNTFWYHGEPALKAGRETGKIFLVEGPTSVMRASQHGLESLVASCGTSMTEEQIAVLRKRFRKGDLILCTDGDNAGQEAAERILSHTLQYGLKVCILPKGKDPDELMQAPQSSESFLRWAEYNTFEGVDFLIERFSKGDILTSVESKRVVLDCFKPVIQHIPLEQRLFYTEAIAQRIGLSSSSIGSFFKIAPTNEDILTRPTYAQPPRNGGNGWERRFWHIMFSAGAPPNVFRQYEEVLSNGIFSLSESKSLIGYAREKNWHLAVDGLDTPLLGAQTLTRLMSEVKTYAATQNLFLNDDTLSSLIVRDALEEFPSPFPPDPGSIAEVENILAHLLAREAEKILNEKFSSQQFSLKTLASIVQKIKSEAPHS